MKLLILPIFAILMIACDSTGSSSNSKEGYYTPYSGPVRYRYTNTLNLGNDMTMDQVSVIGYDDHQVGECTRLSVTVNNASLTLRSANSGNAMYTPSVEKGADGTLVVAWGEIDDGGCQVRLAVKPNGFLGIISRKELDYSAGR